jgi:DNA polymerase III delta prime subunit
VQRIIILEGPDMTGKTQIAQALSEELTLPYWKCEREWTAFKGDPAYFRNTVRYGDEYLLSYLRATGASIVKDRGYPSEWVYSRAMGREADDAAVLHVDEGYASLGAIIVLCRRSTYVGVSDDLFPLELDSQRLATIDALYGTFAQRTKCRVIHVNVDDCDLRREIAEIKNAL